jgi:chromosomal replication initiator protein
MVLACPAADAVCEIERKLQEQIGQRRYQLWFKNATRLAITGQQVQIQVPNNHVKGWIENHFLSQLKSIASETLQQEAEISFEVNADLLKNNQSSSPMPNKPEARPEREVRVGRLRRKLRNNLNSFIIGPSNEMAYNTVQTVAKNVSSPFNPLFIHGACGLGKTHLLQGLCNALSEEHPEAGWHYVSGEEFTNQFIVAVRNGGLDTFRQQYRNVDVLVIDDVHFLANKRATQEEFLHTFNTIIAAGKQVVMASDTHPKQINLLHNSLVDRFISGMVVQINAPDEATRATIVRNRAQQLGHHLSDGVVRLIASRIQSNVRELEGAILKLVAYSSLCNKPIGLDIAGQVVREYGHTEATDIRLGTIEQTVVAYFNTNIGDLHSAKRTRTIALARAVAMYLVRKHTPMSFPEIGKQMGDKNHSTVILACKKIENLLSKNEPLIWDHSKAKLTRSAHDVINELESQLKQARE